MDSDSFLCAFFHFVARRGVPRDVYSDNGTNFEGAIDDFQRALERWDQNKIHSKLLSEGSNWYFGPPEAHHPGGAWEMMIRSVRQVLFLLMSEQTLTDEAEKVYHLIVMASSDVDAFAALTPNDLIFRRQSPGLPPGDFDKNDIYSTRWRQAHYLADVFWKRITSEYLPLLRLCSKWHQPQRNLQVGTWFWWSKNT
jgi:hypothetical protein